MFGKRLFGGSGDGPHAAGDDQVWQGETGALLKKLGLKPDDPGKLVATAADIEERFARGRAALDRKTERANTQLAGLAGAPKVRPYSLIPDPVWNSEHGLFLLYALDLSPFDDWNIVLLPVTEQGALTLNQPLHPGCNLEVAVLYAQDELAKIRDGLAAACEHARQASDFDAYGDAHHAATAQVHGLARQIFAGLKTMFETARQNVASRN